MQIFDNFFLMSQFLNPNYRGNWPCKTKQGSPYARRWKSDILIAVDTLDYYTLGWRGIAPRMRIEQFYPGDIPKGEECWFKIDIAEPDPDHEWVKGRFEDWESDTGYFLSMDNFNIDNMKHRHNTFIDCVPVIIASTPEEAEQRKDWWRV